jgi:hypothetical protein
MGGNCCTNKPNQDCPTLVDPFSVLSKESDSGHVDPNAPSDSKAQKLTDGDSIIKDAHRIIVTTGFKSNSNKFNDGRMALGPYKYRLTGSVYWGQFYQGKRQGYGILINKVGDLYEGEFQMDQMRGSGCLYYESDSSYYIGQVNDKGPNGKGTFKEALGIEYSGEWTDGAK